jgi:hypothetical protein
MEWLVLPGEWLVPPGEWLVPPGEWLATPGEWLVPQELPPGVGLSAKVPAQVWSSLPWSRALCLGVGLSALEWSTLP